MENFNLSNLTNSMINQLNSSLAFAKKSNTHLQTGKRVMTPSDDLGDFSVISKVKAKVKQNAANLQNLQNALSFSQVQDGALKVVSKMIDRSSELKIGFESITSNASDKSLYDEEFKELQLEIKSIRKSKFNGISLFSSASGSVLFEKSQNKNNIFLGRAGRSQDIAISRAGLLGSLKIDKVFPPEIASNAAGGGPDESRVVINLKGPSGAITWHQNPYSVTDHFKAIHGSDVLHEAVYGRGSNIELYDSPAKSGKRTLPRTGPSQSGSRTDIFKFPLNPSNKNPTIELIVNEFGQTSTGTGWKSDYQIEYDPYTLDMLDDKTVWSLGDFDIVDLVQYGENLAAARAENGASQQRILGEIFELQQSSLSHESYIEKGEGLDIARAIGKFNLVRNKISLNADLLRSAQDMENKLYTEYL
jgi:flagellin-like hook-associated protein FlgL